MTKNDMIASMQRYFELVKEAISAGGAASFKYTTGTVPANGQVIYDAPTELGFDVNLYQPYSIGIELRMVDPLVAVDPQVVDATAVLTFAILPDGKIIIKNNHTAVVTYYIRVTMPVKK